MQFFRYGLACGRRVARDLDGVPLPALPGVAGRAAAGASTGAGPACILRRPGPLRPPYVLTWRIGRRVPRRDPQCARRTDLDVYIAGGIFLVAYLLIATERFDRTLVALLGGMLVVVLGILDQHEAFAAIDFNVIFLLAGMMVIAGGPAQDRLLRVRRGPRDPPLRGAARSACC